MNTQGMLDMVEPIADVLFLRLGLYTPKNKEARIVGLPNCSRPHKDSGLLLDMTVKASYLGPKASAVLVRIKGDMYVYTAYSFKENSITLMILNAEKLPMTPKVTAMVTGLHPSQAFQTLKPGIKCVYSKMRNDSLWVKKENIDAQDMVW